MKLDFKTAKEGFFDRAKVLGAINAATRRVLSKFGAHVRTRARTSIKKRSGVSPPGGPPYSHVGLLRRLIFFSYDAESQAVVIGPVLTNSPTGAPENLEYGAKINVTNHVFWVPVAGTETKRKKNRKFERVVYTGPMTIRPRPFMGPALEAEQPGLPAMWANSIR